LLLCIALLLFDLYATILVNKDEYRWKKCRNVQQ